MTVRVLRILLMLTLPLAACVQGCDSGGSAADGGGSSGFSLLWRRAGSWDEHQTVKDGKVYCPMYQENPPTLRVVDLYSGAVEQEIVLGHRCSCAPWFAHGRVYLFGLVYDFPRLPPVPLWPCVYAIDRSAGEVEARWPVFLFSDVEVSNYHPETDRFYLPSGCYEAATGEQVWNLGVALMEQGGVLIVGDTAYYHLSKEFLARDLADGRLVWRLPLAPEDDNKYNTPIYDSDHGLIYIGTDTHPDDDDIDDPDWKRSGTVYAIDVARRAFAWQRRFDTGSIKSTLTYHRGRLFVPLFNNPQGNRLALHWSDGRTLWERITDGDDGWATSAVDDRYLYTASHGQGGFVVQDQQTGEVVWRTQAGPGICCSPIISGGVAVVGTETDVLAVRVGRGKLVDANWRGNPHFTGYTPEAVDIPEAEKVPWPE